MLDESEAESLLVQELRAHAGRTDQPDAFTIHEAGVAVHVRYHAGSGSNLELTTAYPSHARAHGAQSSAEHAGHGGGAHYRGDPAGRALKAVRPLAIELRREIHDDRDQKAKGVNREVQTGDAEFDRRVYIDSPSPDGVILAVLGSARLRAAVIELLELGFPRVRIDDAREEISTSMFVFAEKSVERDRGPRALRALAEIAREVPHVEREEGAHPERSPAWVTPLGLLALVGFFVGTPAWYLAMAPGRCVLRDGDGVSLAGERVCWEPGLVGLATGLCVGYAAAAFVQRLTNHRYVGRSDSSKHGNPLGMIALLLSLSATVLITAFVMWRGV